MLLNLQLINILYLRPIHNTLPTFLLMIIMMIKIYGFYYYIVLFNNCKGFNLIGKVFLPIVKGFKTEMFLKFLYLNIN